MDPARELFEHFHTDGESLIERMVAEAEQENLYLDFKGAARDAAPMQEDDRKTLAEAISGFANSDGGVIVWGVDARKGPGRDDPDVAQATKPIANLARWISDLNGYTPQYVQPAVTGVEHLLIPKSGSSDTGYAVTYVPKSSALHMATAKLKEQYCYFVRSGSSFVKMEHFMVADRFSRRPRPRLNLSLHYTPTYQPYVGSALHALYSFMVGIHNAGLGTALYPALSIDVPLMLQVDDYGLDGNRKTGLAERPRATGSSSLDHVRFFAGDPKEGTGQVVYPGSTLQVIRLNYVARADAENRLRRAVLPYQVFCDGFAGRGELILEVDDLMSLTTERIFYGQLDLQ